MSRIKAAALSIAFLCAFSHAQARAQDAALQQKIEALIHEPQVARAHWGIHVTKLDGTPLVAINEGQLFQPASNNKMFTTATTMALLPVQTMTLKTIVMSNGPIRDGVLRGALTLYGAGDANLSSRTLPYVPRSQQPPQTAPPNDLRYIEEMADQIKAKGITKIDGNVVGDDTLFPWDPYPADWSIDDALWYYGAPINALMIADNAINLKIAPGLKAGDAAVVTLNPALPYYTVENNVTTVAKGEEAHTDIQRSVLVSGGSRVLRLYGTIAIGAHPQSEDIAIEDPAEYAALALKTALEQRGVVVTGKAIAKHRITPEYTFTRSATEPIENLAPKKIAGEVGHASVGATDIGGEVWHSEELALHKSAPLYEDIVVTNKVSQNQHAEMFLHLLGLQFGKDGSTAQGVRVVRTFLTTKAGIDPDDFIFYDGSGLSGHDLVAPRATTQLLRYAATQPWGAAWKASLPVAGVDGSLASRFPNGPVKNHVFAKTGTLSEARALSGYMETASGQTIVFSIMVNAHTPRTHEDQTTMDKIVATIQAAE